MFHDEIPKEYAKWFAENGVNMNALSSTNIKKLMENFKLTWHEHQNMITAQLVPSALHTARYCGIPYIGAVAATNKNANASRVYEMMKQLRR